MTVYQLPYYPVEKNVIRFYRFRFYGHENKPIIIEAINKNEARKKLLYIIQQNPLISGIPVVVDESLFLPIFGTTKKTINSIEHTWVRTQDGQINLSQTGWMPTDEYINLNYD